MSKKPTHADAELILKLYDLRREPVMRESRRAIVQWMPRTFENVAAILDPEHPSNPAWRQVSTYFEMAFGLARHGIVPADFLAENTGEGLLLFAKVEPFLDRLRAQAAPTAFRNAEWIVRKSASARERMEIFRTRFAALRPTVDMDADAHPDAKAAPKPRKRKPKAQAAK